MKRKIKNNDGSFSESKIISTNDIFVGTDSSKSLDDHIKEQDKDIYNLKKWTKWYVKYGGMGSGGGGTYSTTFDHKLYIKDSSQSVEVTKDVVDLWGNGTYTIVFNIIRSQGHSFTITYRIGNSNFNNIYIREGNTSAEITIKLNTKTIFEYNIVDNSTSDETGSTIFSIVPEPFVVIPSLSYQTGSSVSLSVGQPITMSTLNSGLIASFNYSIYKNIEVHWKIRYKIEDWPDWRDYVDKEEHQVEGTFEHSDSGDTVTGSISMVLDNFGLDLESTIGKKIYIELIYGLDLITAVATSIGKYILTIISNGYYILLTDEKDSLYLSEDSQFDKKIKKGYLPFYVKLCHSSNSTTGQVQISVYHKTGSDDWTLEASESSTLNANINFSVASNYTISVTESGLYRIEATIGGTNKTTKYFSVEEDSSTWSFNFYSEKRDGLNTRRIYYDNNMTSPQFKTAITLYNEEHTVNIDINDNNITKYNYNIALGFQYDQSNDDNVPILKLTADTGNPIYVYQNTIKTDNNISIIPEYYLPKTKNSDETKYENWHLLDININFIRSDNSGSVNFYEFTVYIDGIMEGVSSGTVTTDHLSGRQESYTSIALSNNYFFKSIIINPEKTQMLKINLFEVSIVSLGEHQLFTSNDVTGITTPKFKGVYSYMYDIYASNYYNKYLNNLNRNDEIVDSTTLDNHLLDVSFNKFGFPYLKDTELLGLIQETKIVNNSNKRLLNIPIIILCPELNSGGGSNSNISDEFRETIIDKFFSEWFLVSWPQDPGSNTSKIPKIIDGHIYYIPGDTIVSTATLNQFIITDNSDGGIKNIGFNFDIQGSSTKLFGNKNIELSINQTSSVSTRVFTPNFDRDDTNSFLPEESFTLKADMVDSSTCNNNSIGDFINKNTTPLDKEHCISRKDEHLGGHIKNCLTGFPVLVFIKPEVDNIYKPNRFYFSGIYNFNLGRKSYFNLGYYSRIPEEISNLYNSAKQGEFQVLTLNSMPEFHNNLVVTEISDGVRYYDFSQYDDSILFSESEDDPYTMFSMKNSIFKDKDSFKDTLRKSIKSISKAGGYIFERLHKNFVPIDRVPGLPYLLGKNNVSLNCVSDYKIQYLRTARQSEYHRKEETISPAEFNDLIRCVGSYYLDEDNNLIQNDTIRLDLHATVEYYVICMIFGMVDSVLKNLELKAWNNNTIFPAFYDMDTALGVDNNGESVNYFAFSDFWKNNESVYNEGLNQYYSDGVNIYPDFFSSESGMKGYDIPSSYLFAVAKYATMELMNPNGLIKVSELLPNLKDQDGSVIDLSPVNLYAIYRRIGGPLETSDHFIDTYFSNRLENIPRSLKNLNYRSKYAKVAYWLISDYDSEVDNKITDKRMRVSGLSDISKFNGTGINKKRDWLNHRLKLLDSYFNISANDVKYPVEYAICENLYDNGNINPDVCSGNGTLDLKKLSDINWDKLKKSNNPPEYYYYPTMSVNASFGSDVSIVSQFLFQPGGTKTVISINTLEVKAPSYTPIIFFISGHSPVSYLIGDDSNKKSYIIRNLSTVGNQAWYLFGSTEFTSVNNIGLFRLSDSTVNSDNIKSITYSPSSDIGNITTQNYNLNTPNIESIRFSGNIYTGNLVLSQQSYNKLNSIDISGTSISINSSLSLPITSLIINKIPAEKNSTVNIILTNLPNISKVQLEESRFGELNLPLWKSSVSITGGTENGFDYTEVSINKLTIINRIINSEGRFKNSEIRLNNLSTLETVKIEGIDTLTITNCPKLNEITIDNNIKRVIVTNCSSTATKQLIISGTTTGNPTSGKLDFSDCEGLSYLSLTNTRKFTIVDIGSNEVTLPASAFSGCIELEYINNSENGTYYLSGTNTFYRDSNFKLKQSNGTYPNIQILSNSTNSSSPITSDISSTFNCSSSAGSIDFDAANNFLTNLNFKGKITKIDNLFYGHPGIGQNWGWDTYFDSLNQYTALTSVGGAFAYCGIKYRTKEMYDFGSSSFDLNGISVYYYSSVNATVDFLKNIGGKLTAFSDFGSSGAGLTYTFYQDKNSGVLTTVEMKDVLKYLTKVKTLNAFETISNTTVDLKDCFEDCHDDNGYSLYSISRFIRTGNNWENLTYTTNDGITRRSCFSCLNNLKEIHTGFTNTSTNEKIDLFYLFTENQWKSLEKIYPYTDNFPNIFSANKTITAENYLKLTGYIGSNNRLNSILANSLCSTFRNCTITDCDNDPVLTLGLYYPSSITKLYHVFDNVKAIDKNNHSIKVKLDYDFFKNLKKLTSCIGLFCNNSFSNIIPFDFFKKRIQIKGSGYVSNRENPRGEWNYNDYDVYCYCQQSDPPIPPSDAPQDDSGDWKIARNTYIKGSTDSVYRYLYGAKYGESAVRLEVFEEPTSIQFRYFAYPENERTIDTVSEMFRNCEFDYPYFKFACYDNSNNMLSGEALDNAQQRWIEENTSYIKDGNGTEYDSFYTDYDCKTPYTNYRPSYEIEDLILDKQKFYINDAVTVNSHSDRNFTLTHGTNGEEKIYPIVATDFFYGLASSCDIQSIFAYDKADSWKRPDIKLLEGYLPSHLFSLTTNLLNCKNFIKELNIIPVRHNTDDKFVFVPQKFINNFTISNITNLFNFRIRVPNDTDDFYIMYSNSLNTGKTVRLDTNEFLPRHVLHYSSGTTDGIIAEDGSKIHPVYRDNFNYHYHVMLNADGTDGFLDEALSKNMTYSNLVSRDLLYVLSGKIWSDDFRMETFNNRGITSPVFEGIITVNNETIGVNRNFIFPEVRESSFNGYSNNVLPSINRVHQNSLNGCEAAWINTYSSLRGRIIS